jgi:hypothetical protein
VTGCLFADECGAHRETALEERTALVGRRTVIASRVPSSVCAIRENHGLCVPWLLSLTSRDSRLRSRAAWCGVLRRVKR